MTAEVNAGEPMSVQALWEGFSAELRHFVTSRIGDPATADDIVQEVFVRIHRALESGESPRHPRAWLYRITRNAVIDHVRARDSERARREAVEADPAWEDAPDARSLQGLWRCLQPILDGLDEPSRQALEWTDLGELTQAEAARRAGVSVSGMKSRVQRAREKLRDGLLACCKLELDHRGVPVGSPCLDGCGPGCCDHGA